MLNSAWFKELELELDRFASLETTATLLLAVELTADAATELNARLDETATREEVAAIEEMVVVEEMAVEEGATLLAGAVDDAGLGGFDPPPPPPPQAVNNPLRVRVRSNFGLYINRSYLLSDLIGDTNGFTVKI